ncbi:ATP-binding protein [Amycolatopsis aidingensis]|uniref:ATP-binding protein n=1 Tax=Amycolatopsis aidingensis TaxID=2842453 RepID=UPI002FCACBD1
MERTAYRVVQEALTNAGKHAVGGPVRVRVEHRPADVAITVVNNLVGKPLRAPLPESGYGLAGLPRPRRWRC